MPEDSSWIPDGLMLPPVKKHEFIVDIHSGQHKVLVFFDYF